jgi:hypothetical protein
MSLLTIVQAFCERTQLPVPSTVLGTSDAQVMQVRALLEEEGEALSRRGDWEGLTLEASHTTLATEDQGAMTSIATNGFQYIKDETMWDRTDKLPIPLMHSTKWQRFKASVSTAPRYHYRIRGGELLMHPTPTAGHSVYFEYISKNWILGADLVTYKSAFTLDTDTVLLPEELVRMGLRWRWKKEHGLEYAEDFRDYEMRVADALGRDGGKPTLYMDNGFTQARPGVVVPEYNWPL